MSKIPKNVKSIIEKYAGTKGDEYIAAKEIAVLIRYRLKEVFPGVKFSVRSEAHRSVWIGWENGPSKDAVDSVVSCYEFGGFDGMIDMQYSSSNWLLEDGSMVPAKCRGTQGSMGYVEACENNAPENAVAEVQGGFFNVSLSRDVSDDVLERKYRLACQYFGWDWQEGVKPWNQLTPTGNYLDWETNRCQRAEDFDRSAVYQLTGYIQPGTDPADFNFELREESKVEDEPTILKFVQSFLF